MEECVTCRREPERRGSLHADAANANLCPGGNVLFWGGKTVFALGILYLLTLVGTRLGFVLRSQAKLPESR